MDLEHRVSWSHEEVEVLFGLSRLYQIKWGGLGTFRSSANWVKWDQPWTESGCFLKSECNQRASFLLRGESSRRGCGDLRPAHIHFSTELERNFLSRRLEMWKALGLGLKGDPWGYLWTGNIRSKQGPASTPNSLGALWAPAFEQAGRLSSGVMVPQALMRT